jgi:hypothetical protein
VTRTGPRKPVDAQFWAGRLANARAYREAAHQAAALAEPSQNANPLVSHIVSAAMGYADALTSRYGGMVNQQDHQVVVKAVRAALGNRTNESALKQLTRILREKDAAQYGARVARLDHAVRLLDDLDEFAEWAEREVADA